MREVHAYVYACALDYVDADRCAASEDSPAGAEVYDVTHADGPVSLVSKLVSLPAKGRGFPACDYVGPELAAFGRAEESALDVDFTAELAATAKGVRSCHKVEPAEYAALLAHMHAADMLELTAEHTGHPLGVFGVWKVVGQLLRLIVDGRPANAFFRTPEYEHTGGDSLARIQVDAGMSLEVAKCDLADFFHCCEAPDAVRPYLGLRRVLAADLRDAGVAVPVAAGDAGGYTWPRLTTLPMGWKPSPGIAQGSHEAVLYGSLGGGSELARALPPVLEPAARWSSERVPELDSPGARTPHALVVDDLLLFRMVPRRKRSPPRPL